MAQFFNQKRLHFNHLTAVQQRNRESIWPEGPKALQKSQVWINQEPKVWCFRSRAFGNNYQSSKRNNTLIYKLGIQYWSNVEYISHILHGLDKARCYSYYYVQVSLSKQQQLYSTSYYNISIFSRYLNQCYNLPLLSWYFSFLQRSHKKTEKYYNIQYCIY